MAVEYMDRFLLLRHHFAGQKKQNLSSLSDLEFVTRIFDGQSVDSMALSCLLLASKFDEIDDNIPLM